MYVDKEGASGGSTCNDCLTIKVVLSDPLVMDALEPLSSNPVNFDSPEKTRH